MKASLLSKKKRRIDGCPRRARRDRLDARALVSLSIEQRLSDRLATPELRRRVFDALADAPRNTVSLEGGLMPVDLGCLPSSRPKRRAT